MAQNGISIDVLQNDPYFSNGGTEDALERNPSSDIMKEDGVEQPNRQLTNPSDSSTFYNSKNWPGFVPGMDTSPNPTAPGEIQQEENKTKVKEKNEAPFTIVNPNYTEDMNERDLFRGWWKKSWFEASVYYSALYAPNFLTPTTLATLLMMDQSKNFNFLGAMANVAFLPARFSKVKLGIGLTTSYNALITKKDYYVFSTNLVTANGSLLMRILCGTYASFDLFAGGGALMFLDTKTTYANNYSTPSYNWIFANVMGGLGLEFYFTRFIGSDIRLIFNWPFKTDDPFPFLQLGIGVGVRL